jgi:hypothetical protein
MKQTLTTPQAANILADDEYSSFSRAGAYALVEYLEQLEEDTGEEMDFCHVGIRCDYSEYSSLVDWARDYFGADKWKRELDIDLDDLDDEVDEAIRSHIQERGTLIEFDGGIIVSSF